MIKVAIIYHSDLGHTKVIAEHILIGALSKTEEAQLFDCKEVNWEYLNSCQAIIFGCPTYMGSTSAEFKAFMDSTSHIWSKQKWRNKVAAGFTNSAAMSGDKLGTLIQISLFAFQHGMVWVGLDLMAGNASSKGSEKDLNRIGSWIGLMTQTNTDQSHELSPPDSDKKTAEYFGQRVVNIAKNINFDGV
jgi:multimeric flavodoxin WrbA